MKSHISYLIYTFILAQAILYTFAGVSIRLYLFILAVPDTLSGTLLLRTSTSA
ncbi:hypothetical protein [Pontibacter flavimaris]|uniref:hypothetical protein n=1 Tax=Pontibacter flavimaris TaxID=1797110 RepID=UPI00147AAC69|nr:hypothetical protein [Pontibacter flavimaris]